MKRSKNLFLQFFATGVHATIHMAIVMVAMDLIFRQTGLYWADWQTIVDVGMLVFIFHFSIDFVRCVVESRILGFGGWHIGWKYAIKSIWQNRWSKHVVSGLVDQSLHLVSLVVIVVLMR
jgi:hypothetical protein